MTDNELIAEWLEWLWNGREIKLHKGGLTATSKNGMVRLVWSPSTDITLWHGEDGILAEIEKRNKHWQFRDALLEICDHKRWPKGLNFSDAMAEQDWRFVCTPVAQLTAALVKLIKETT